MKCYYEILSVTQEATDDELKKSYRKLALKWHPDKNLDRVEEAKEQFQLVQQAYEVLNDPQERAWYDKHRDSILKGGLGKDYCDDSLNLYPYFSSSCFKGYGDEDNGFYSVYREVFNKISAEDSQYDSDLDSDNEIPDFGDSKSPYQNKVYSFYSYWQSYSTKRSFSWLDEFDIRKAPNRRIARLMEKENKKLRDAARKERNEQVRRLVYFVRKRDKRAQEYAKVLERRAIEQAEKVKQLQLEQRRQRQEEIERQSRTQSLLSQFANFEEELKQIEENLVAEFNDELTEESVSDNENDDTNSLASNLYCSACNKVFKTEQAFMSHEKSKKHREKVQEMNFNDPTLQDLDEGDSEEVDLLTGNTDEPELSLGNVESEDEEESPQSSKKKKKKNKKKNHLVINNSTDSEPEDAVAKASSDSDSGFEVKKSKNKRFKRKGGVSNQNKSKPEIDKPTENLTQDNTVGDDTHDSNTNKGKKGKHKVKTLNRTVNHSSNEVKSTSESTNSDHTCRACTTTFISNNELFKHLKKTGHALPPSISGQPTPFAATNNKKRGKN